MADPAALRSAAGALFMSAVAVRWEWDPADGGIEDVRAATMDVATGAPVTVLYEAIARHVPSPQQRRAMAADCLRIISEVTPSQDRETAP